MSELIMLYVCTYNPEFAGLSLLIIHDTAYYYV